MDEKELEGLAVALLVWLWGDEEEIEERVDAVMEAATVEETPLPVIERMDARRVRPGVA